MLQQGQYLGQGSPPEEDREGVAPIVVLMQLQDLYCVILQEVVQPVGPPVPIQGLPVIPHTVEAQHLRPPSSMHVGMADHTHTSNPLYLCSGHLQAMELVKCLMWELW